MKNYCKLGAVLALSAYSFVAMADNDLTVKVMNIPSSQGRVLVATSMGQYGMAEAQSPETTLILKNIPEGKCSIYAFHDENNNYQLDMENGLPKEFCAELKLEVNADTKTVELPLLDLQKVVKKVEE